jgi:SAM-dependent methyltransferase
MMTAPSLRSTTCAVCGPSAGASEIYPANFDLADFSPAVFSARRVPDRIHYRIVQCDACGLVRSDPVADAATMARLYGQSTFDYEREVPNLVRTYGRYLLKLSRYEGTRRALLEIGCGNGFFLDCAARQGYTEVYGVEPGKAAVAGAPPELRERIVCDVMRPGLFEHARFDVICAFQVLDHIPDPLGFLQLCREILRPGGLLLCLHHNIGAWTSRILGEHSPIIDIEHTFLYSSSTLSKLLQKAGFDVTRIGTAWNTYSLRYLMQLVPAPKPVKRRMLTFLERSEAGRLRMRVPLGNLYAIAQRRG